MNTIYRIRRGVLSLYSNVINKIVMLASGIAYGEKFHSCGTILYCRYGGTMQLGDNVCINSHLIADPIGGQTKTILVTSGNGRLIIGNNVGISNAAIFSSNNITIDDYAVLGAGCKIYDNDFHSSIADYRLDGNSHILSAPVHIGKRTFIGGHSIILKGVTIGEGAVIAAGSVVSKSVPANEVWGGNPAKFIKSVEQL